MNCTKRDSCEKISTILDKDMLDFQYTDCINDTCSLCKNKMTPTGPSWMPVNPCDGCAKEDEMGYYYDFNNECRCSIQSRYYHEKYAVEKLLRWIIDFQKINPWAIGITHTAYLESMLRQLGEI